MNTSTEHSIRIANRQRIYSIDFIRGLVMILMVLDHARFFFYYGSFLTDPLDLETTTPALFLTRWITHLCAPVFVLLAGVSIHLDLAKRKDVTHLSLFLLSRGIWLIALEFGVITFAWFFDPRYQFFNVQVIWAIGACFVLFAGLIHLPASAIVGIGVAILLGHNLVSGVSFQEKWMQDIWIFSMSHGTTIIGNKLMGVYYPVIPWLGIMCLGYGLGLLYTGHGKKERQKRQRKLLGAGIGFLVAFIILRFINSYGDPVGWSAQKNLSLTILSFLQVTKYPPSLLFSLVTLGIAGLGLWAFDQVKQTGLSRMVITFGRVPLFFYILHLFVIHLLAFLGTWVDGHPLKLMIITPATFQQATLTDYGFPLWVVYGVWGITVALLYPVCRWYQKYKMAHPEKWILRYL